MITDADIIVKNISEDMILEAMPYKKILDQYNEGRHILDDKVAHLESAIADRTLLHFLGATYDSVPSHDLGIERMTKKLMIENKTQVLKNAISAKSYHESDIIQRDPSHLVPQQKADIFAFTSINMGYRTVSLTGWLTYDQFVAKCQLIKAGTSRPNGLVFRASSWVVQNTQLNPILWLQQADPLSLARQVV